MGLVREIEDAICIELWFASSLAAGLMIGTGEMWWSSFPHYLTRVFPI